MSDFVEAVAAPALSTAQDEEEAFAKVDGLSEEILREKRRHLGPQYTQDIKVTSRKTRELISEYYSLPKLAKFLNSRNVETADLKYPLISLQFPDDLVCDSTIVSQILQEELNKMNKEVHDIRHEQEEKDALKNVENEIDFTTSLKAEAASMSRDIESVEKTIENKSCGGACGSQCKNKSKFYQEVWILADTSYSPCCIDEVAAEHIKADIVVHFGDACLNPVDKIQSCYVFGKPFIDFEKLVQTFTDAYTDKEEKVAVMADTPHSYILPQLSEKLAELGYTNIVIANIDYAKAGKRATIIDMVDTKNDGEYAVHSANRILTGFNPAQIDEYLENIDYDDENYIESSKYDELTREYSLFHLTKPHDARILLLSTKFSDLKVVDPGNVEFVHDQFPTLMKRYRNMQVARSATTIGVLVNTLSLANTKELLNKIVKSIIEAGKKHYMFVVGKPNVAKLANFECVDAWCILGCGQSGIVVDMYGDYYKPIITPYELQLALMPQVTWTGKWVTDFDAMLEKQDQEEPLESEHPEDQTTGFVDEDHDEFAPEFDPVSGTLKMNQPLRQLRHLELELDMENENRGTESTNDSETALVQRLSGTLSLGKTVSTAALGLQSRAWTGLGSDFQEEDAESSSSQGALVEDGRTGVARGYSGV